MTIPLDEQIAEVARELAMRKNAYPKFVERGSLKQPHADKQMARLEAVMKTLGRIYASRAKRNGEAMNPTNQELVNNLRLVLLKLDVDRPGGGFLSTTLIDTRARLTSLSQANERMAGALQEFVDVWDRLDLDEGEIDYLSSGRLKPAAELARSTLSDLSAPPGDTDADLPTAEDVRGILRDYPIAPPAAAGWQWKPGEPRCDQCDNGLHPEWICCPHCGEKV